MFDGRSPAFRRRVRWTAWGVAAVLVIWIVASTVVVWQARSSTESGLNQLTAIRDELSPAELLAGEGNEALARAVDDFNAGHGHASSVVLAPWHIVPLVSDNVRSAQALTAAAAHAGTRRAAGRAPVPAGAAEPSDRPARPPGPARPAPDDRRERPAAPRSGAGANVMSFLPHEAHKAVLNDFLDAIEQGTGDPGGSGRRGAGDAARHRRHPGAWCGLTSWAGPGPQASG